jgi:myo-inositol-hexaphosphate 3-phosphohydrolase
MHRRWKSVGKGTGAAALSSAAMLAVAGLLVGLVAPVANAAVVQVSATVETAPMHGAGDAADDPAIWIHPTDPSKSTIIGTDKSTDGHGLVVYDLSGRELFYYPDGRMNNVDVRYNFPLGGTPVALVGVTNRVRSLDFYKVNVGDRSLTKVGSFAPGTDIQTPRGFTLYHSPVTGKYYAYVTDSGKIEQWELDGSTGSVTGRLVRKWTLGGVTEGLVADDEMKRLYVAQEDVGGIWRIGAEASDSTAGTKVVSTTETGGDIVQDIKGITIYYGSGGAGYLLAASQGSDRFHVYAREDNRPLGAFQIVAGNGVDAVTGMDGIDVTNFGVGGPFPQGFFITQDHGNDGGNQSFKLVPWQTIAATYSPPLLVDAAYDPREIGRGGTTTPGAPDTTITSKPDNPTNSTSASFGFSSTATNPTFACALDSTVFTTCTSPASFTGLAEGTHTFQVRASDTNGTDSTPASYTWKVDKTPPETTITSDPPASTSTSPSFAFSSTETGSTFQCRLDDASYASCTSPKGYTGLTSGPHTFSVKATDAAGNTDPTPETQSWTISSTETPGSGIVRESVSTAVNTTAASTLKIPRPAGVAAGDVLVGCVSLTGGTISATTGVPAGWTPLAAVTSLANPKVYGYYKLATTSEPADYTWATSSTTSGGAIVRYSGASGVDISAKSAYGSAASSGSVPGVTTTTPSAMLVGCMSVNSTSVTLTSPTGMSQAAETGARRFEIADGNQATAGGSGTKTWTFSAARDWAGWLVALRPKGN